MLEYARWKYILVSLVLLISLIFALPIVFGEDPALQLARKDREPVSEETRQQIEEYLRKQDVQFTRSYIDDGRLMIRFPNVGEQLEARDAVNAQFSKEYAAALSFAPRTPEFMRKLGLRPMPLGLDLRGGLYLLYEVDMNSAMNQLLENYAEDMRRALQQAKIPFTDAVPVALEGDLPNAVRVTLAPDADVDAARDVLARALSDLTFETQNTARGPVIHGVLSEAQVRARQDYAIQQSITTLRNRVNELGVAEPIVQRQGVNRVNVQLPGVQNSAEVKDILGKVATLEFRLEDTQNNPYEAQRRDRAPFGSRLYTYQGQPVLLKRDIIVTGDQVTDATSTMTQDGPGVSVRLDSRGGDEMLKTTRANLNRRMGVVFIEKTREPVLKDGKPVEVDGKPLTREVTRQEVINLATIRGIFSNQFQITGMSQAAARELALLLRAGSLAAPLELVEERAVGPSLGQENIEMGVRALVVGMLGLFVFMALYYHVFGLVADLVLLANVVVLTALLSMFGAALSLPGIAGIILTVGMAVDANVLIYERIREELRRGVSPQAAIRAGFEKAFSAIADSNITTLIAGIVLWIFGTGPVRGFAVVLTLGIATSMFTALMGSRALLTLMYGGKRKLAALPIG